MRIDDFAPDPDATETHQLEIDAPASVVYDALWKADLAASPIVRALMKLRSLPAVLSGARERRSEPATLRLQQLLDGGFGLLAEEPGREIVVGVSGRFWRPIDNLLPFRREDFDGPVAAGTARAVWNFAVTPQGSGTLLTTETRVICGDAASRLKFRTYWLLVRPFSGWIRHIMLAAVARECAARRAPGHGDKR